MRRYFPIILFVFAGCAQKVPLTGGVEDKIPPKLLQVNPPNRSKIFSGPEIRLEFNEAIQLKNQNTEVILSPPHKNKPEFTVQGNELKILIKDTLKKNTTYLIDFRKSITDAHEGNVMDSTNQYVFSTGENLDTMIVSGQVKDALTGEALDQIWVALYAVTDSEFVNPLFLSKTNTDGRFNLTYLTPGMYSILALQDVNSNLKYDLPNEKIGFDSNPVFVSDSTKLSKLSLFDEVEPLKKIELIKQELQKPGRVQLIFSNDINTFSWDNSLKAFEEHRYPNDTLTFWLKDTSLLVAGSILSFLANDTLRDTVIVPDRQLQIVPLKTETKPSLKWDEDLMIHSNYPMSAVFAEYMILKHDSVKEKGFTVQIDSLDARQLRLKHNWKPDTKYLISIAPQAIVYEYQTQHKDTLKFHVATDNSKKYIHLNLNLISEDSSRMYLLQFMKEGKTVIREHIFTGNHTTVPELLVQSYTMRLIVDDNRDHKWTPGILKTKQLPEQVYHYQGQLELQEGFDLDLNWKLE